MSCFSDYWGDGRTEREFIESGYECFTRTNGMGHRCGYVALPEGHPLFGEMLSSSYGDCEVPEVDGGVTFSEPIGGYWVLGWDAAHCWHMPDVSIMDEYFLRLNRECPPIRDEFAVMVDADMAEEETRSFAKALAAMVDKGASK